MAKVPKNGRGPTEARLRVFDLQLKLKKLYILGLQLGVVTKQFSNNSLCNELKDREGRKVLHQRTLYESVQKGSSNPKDPKEAGDETLPIRALEAIGRLFKFPAVRTKLPDGSWSLPWDEWIAPPDWKGSERPDSAKNFKARYIREHSDPGASVSIDAGKEEGQLAEQIGDEALEVKREYAPDGPLPGLASVVIYAGQTRLKKTLISATVFTDQYLVPDTGKWLKVAMGILALRCGNARADLRSIKSFKIDGTNGLVAWTVSGPSRAEPRWRLATVSGTPLGDVGRDPIGLVNVEGLADGDEIEATFGTWFSLVSSAVTLEQSFQGDDIKDRVASQSDLNVAQQKLIELLEKRAVDTDQNNFGVIASYKLVFGRR